MKLKAAPMMDTAPEGKKDVKAAPKPKAAAKPVKAKAKAKASVKSKKFSRKYKYTAVKGAANALFKAGSNMKLKAAPKMDRAPEGKKDVKKDNKKAVTKKTVASTKGTNKKAVLVKKIVVKKIVITAAQKAKLAGMTKITVPMKGYHARNSSAEDTLQKLATARDASVAQGDKVAVKVDDLVKSA